MNVFMYLLINWLSIPYPVNYLNGDIQNRVPTYYIISLVIHINK